MAIAEKDPNFTDWWWRYLNSAFIWITVAILIILVFVTSRDPADPTQFTQFGANQILILGFITVLFLFKYISKIKIGPVEIDFRALERIERTLNDARQDVRTAPREGLTKMQLTAYDTAADKITEAIGIVKSIKDRYS